jgi:hypothetical protein
MNITLGEKMKVYLCGNGHCPAVEILEDKVLIGENGKTAILTKKQWNSLVEKIKKGELDSF